MAQGNVATILGNGWELGAVIDPKTGDPSLKDKLSTFPLPGTSAGKPTPSFLGGSDIAVPAKASRVARCRVDQDLHGHGEPDGAGEVRDPQHHLAAQRLRGAGQANQSTGEAAKETWFVPNTPNWANVETGNVLQNMLESIATGKSSIPDATKSADAQIATTLNAGN